MSDLIVAPVLHLPHARRRAHVAFLARYWPIVLVIVAFVALAVRYSVSTPLFEAPGEPAYVERVLAVARGAGTESPDLADSPLGQQAVRQPPLYYALGGLLTYSVDVPKDVPLYEPNPYSALGTPGSPANKNAVLHLRSEGFPYRGVSLAVHLLRWFSVLAAAVAVALTYGIALEIVPGRRALAAGAAALAAFNPQFLFISAAATVDALAVLWMTAAVYVALRLANDRGSADASAALLGAFVGLAMLTRVWGLVALALIPAAGLARVRSWNTRHVLAEALRPAAIGLVVALAIAGWWYVRDIAQHGNLAGLVFFGEESRRFTLSDLWSAAGSLVLSYWGVFGWMNVLADETYYSLVRILTMLGVLGMVPALAWVYWRHRTFRPYRWRAALVLGAWPVIVLASLLASVSAIAGLEGRLLFPAISSLAFFMFVGITAWFPRRYLGVLGFLLVAGLAVVALRVPTGYISPAYAVPPRIALEDVPASIMPLDVSYGDELFLLGYDLPQESVRAGENLRVRLYWLARKAMTEDYTVNVYVAGRRGERIGGIDTYPGGGNLPTRLWLPGDVVVDEYVVPIRPDAVGPTSGAIRVKAYGGPDGATLTARDARLRPIEGGVEIGRVRVAPAKPVRPDPAHKLAINLGHRVVLLGYDVTPSAPEAGKNLVVELHWRPLARLTHDYTVFVHLVDADGALVTQVDEQPVQGDYPTHLWIAEEVVRDSHTLALPADLATGAYRLEVGLYLVETGERLEIIGSDPPETAVTLNPVEISGR